MCVDLAQCRPLGEQRYEARLVVEREPEFRVDTPPELLAGSYANFVRLWHSAYEFTLEFAIMEPPEDDDENVVP